MHCTARLVTLITLRTMNIVVFLVDLHFFVSVFRPGLDAKFKLPKLSHRMCAAYALSIKNRQNKNIIA